MRKNEKWFKEMSHYKKRAMSEIKYARGEDGEVYRVFSDEESGWAEILRQMEEDRKFKEEEARKEQEEREKYRRLREIREKEYIEEKKRINNKWKHFKCYNDINYRFFDRDTPWVVKWWTNTDRDTHIRYFYTEEEATKFLHETAPTIPPPEYESSSDEEETPKQRENRLARERYTRDEKKRQQKKDYGRAYKQTEEYKAKERERKREARRKK